MAVKATWLGEEGDHKETIRFGVTFKKGESVDISDIPVEQQRKLAGNPQFKVEGFQEPGTQAQVPPSQQGAQGPAPKPGEPKPNEPKKV